MDEKKLRRRVFERDDYLCVECGAQATEAHHILGRRYGKIIWQEKAMISLCHRCHLYQDGGAHRKVKRKEYLELLRERHNYDYSEQVFKEALNAI